jgi:hypothetical protein
MDDGAAPELELIRPGIDKAVRVAQEVLEERESILENPTCHRCDTQFGGRELHPGANWYWCPACEEIFEAELGADTDSASSRGRGRRWPAWAIVVGVLLALLYFNGSLDKPLSSVHLNFHSCIENALGATFCGDDATRYCKNTADLRHLGGGSANDACDKLLAP